MIFFLVNMIGIICILFRHQNLISPSLQRIVGTLVGSNVMLFRVMCYEGLGADVQNLDR